MVSLSVRKISFHSVGWERVSTRLFKRKLPVNKQTKKTPLSCLSQKMIQATAFTMCDSRARGSINYKLRRKGAMFCSNRFKGTISDAGLNCSVSRLIISLSDYKHQQCVHALPVTWTWVNSHFQTIYTKISRPVRVTQFSPAPSDSRAISVTTILSNTIPDKTIIITPRTTRTRSC